MQWATKQQNINPIPSSVEIKLLKRAYKARPTNFRIFSKLIEALTLENKFSKSTQICEQHLRDYPQDDNVYAVLCHLHGKSNNIPALIETAESALHYSPKVETKLQLAYAYAATGKHMQAIEALPSYDTSIQLTADQLKLVFKTLILVERAEQIREIFDTLALPTQEDSGLKSYYIKALYMLDAQSEIDTLIDHQSLITEYSLSENNSKIDISELNQQLTKFLLSHSQLLYEPGNHTTRNGSQLYFESHWHPCLQELENLIRTSVERYFSGHKLYKSNTDQSFTLNIWANVLGKKGHQISHIHPSAIVSGVYYINIPNSISHPISPADRQGCLLFSQPETNSTRYVRPSEGLVVLFPSYFYHQTIPLEYEETRVCVAFDVISAN